MNNVQLRNEIIGTVCAETSRGAIVVSDELPPDAVCFCQGCFTKGDKALFTIRKYTYTEEGLKIQLDYDCMLEYAYAA